MPASPYSKVRIRREVRGLKLRELGYADYPAYLRSPHWWQVRQRFQESDQPQDCICGETENLQLHHLTYERVGAEELTDLTWLCANCHAMTHALEVRGDMGLDFTGFVNEARAERYEREQRDLEGRRVQDLADPQLVQQRKMNEMRSELRRLKQLCLAEWKAGRDPRPVLDWAIAELKAM